MNAGDATPQAAAVNLLPSKELELPTPPTGEEEAGSAVAVNNGLVVVGAQIAEGSEGEPSGKVYVFEEEVPGSNKLNLIATLESTNQGSLTTFGSSVAMNDDYIVVGAARETAGGKSQAGHVYTFRISDVRNHVYTPYQTLKSGTPQTNGLFGFSVAISGTNVVVGAPFETAAGHTRAGNIYIFDAETAGEPAPIRTLTSPNAAASGNFGMAVALEGEELVVGAPSEKPATGEGQVYVYEHAITEEPPTAKTPPLTNPESPTAIESFGSSVAISSGLIVVGAELYGTPAGIGAVYVFERSTEAHKSTLTNPASPVRAHFGIAVAIASGERVIVGAPENDEAEPGDGAAYVFAATGGALTDTLEDPATGTEKERGAFGISVAASGTEVLVGASRQNREATELAGNAYVYTL